MVNFKIWMFLSCTGFQWNMNCQRTEDKIYCKLGPSNPFWSFCGKSASSQIRINKKLLGGGVHLRKNWEPFLQAAESLWGHFVLLPMEKFSWLLLLFLHSEWFAVMNKCYRMAYDFFSRACPCQIQEISQLSLVCSFTSLAVFSLSAELFTDALGRWWQERQKPQTCILILKDFP